MFEPDTVPAHVPSSKASQWAAVFSNVYKSALDDGDKSREECEARAYAAANAILSRRSVTFKADDFVSWTNDSGIRQRGKVKGFPEPDAKAMDTENAGPLVEVEVYHPSRDGWESSGKTVSVSADGCIKIENLSAPSRVPRKAPVGSEVNEASVKAIIDAAIADALENIKAAQSLPNELMIKRLDEDTIGGYAVVFGNEKEHDIEGDYFTKNTDLWLDVYKSQPIFFDHAVGVKAPGDPTEGDDNTDPRYYKLGHITKVAPDDVGVWIEGVLDAHNSWVRGVWELVDKGALFFSSGSAPHLIKRTESGEVKSWPIIEVSLTPTPAEPRKTIVRNTTPDPARVAKREPMGGSLRSANGEASAEDGALRIIEGAVKSKKDNTGANTMAYSNQRKLNGLLTALWSDELEEAVFGVKAAKRNVKEAAPEELEDAAEEVAVAASKLDEMVGPIVEQAKSVLGLDPDQVKGTLLKMAFAKVNADFPGEEEETPEEAAAEEPIDEVAEGEEMPMPEEEEEDPEAIMSSTDFLRFGPDEVPEDEYLDSEEDLPGMGKSYRSTDVERMVERAMTKLSKSRGGYQVKKFNVNKLGRDPRNPLQAFIMAAKRNNEVAIKASARAAGEFKAMGINPDTTGGYLVPIEQSNQVIELLRNQSLFLAAQGDSAQAKGLLTELPLNRDTLTIPRATGDPTTYWLGENSTISASDASLGQIQLIAKKLACRVVLSNELLADASVDVDNFIRDAMSKAMAREVDRVVLYGQGAAGEPLGVSASGLTYKTAKNAALDYDDLVTLVSQPELNNVELDDSVRFILNPRDKFGLRNLQDGSGNYVFNQNGLAAATEGVPQQLFGYPFISSNVVARTGSPEETDVFFGKWSDVILGWRKTIEIVASDVAGTSFEADQTWIRAIMRLDVALRHPESIAMITDVRAVAVS